MNNVATPSGVLEAVKQADIAVKDALRQLEELGPTSNDDAWYELYRAGAAIDNAKDHLGG